MSEEDEPSRSPTNLVGKNFTRKKKQFVPFWNLSFYESPFAKAHNALDISFIVELVVSGIVYLIVSRSINLGRDAQAARASEEQLIAAGLITPSIHESAL